MHLDHNAWNSDVYNKGVSVDEGGVDEAFALGHWDTRPASQSSYASTVFACGHWRMPCFVCVSPLMYWDVNGIRLSGIDSYEHFGYIPYHLYEAVIGMAAFFAPALDMSRHSQDSDLRLDRKRVAQALSTS